MQTDRRQLLRSAGLAAATLGLAGCNSDSGTGTETATRETATPGTAASPAQDSSSSGDATTSVSAETAVAAEWNVMRSRLDDAYMLGLAGTPGTGATVAQNVFQRFEGANGEYGAHEMLEATSESDYEGFEEALEGLISDLEAGDTDAAEDAWADAQTNLRAAQRAVLDEEAANAFDLLRFGGAVNNIEVLAAAGHTGGASTAAGEVKDWFEDATVHSDLESADTDAYESFESAIESAESAAGEGNIEEVRQASDDALAAAVTGAGAIAGGAELTGTGHLAAMQAQGWDAAVLSSLGGPSTAFAHAAVLTTYRARAHDAAWLAERGATERATAMVEDVFGHFEADRKGHHEALEEADGEAYEGFESGLDALTNAIENDGDVETALGTVDDNLVAGTEALAGGTGAAVLEAAFFRSRFADARELFRLGENGVAADVAQSLFQTFEQDEAGFHETFEDADHEGYESFEESLASLQTAFENGDDSGVETHVTGVMDALLDFETTAGSTAHVSAAESAYMTARAFDASALAALGETGRAGSIIQSTFEHFEAGAGGFHEALEEADHETYESFEEHLGAIRNAASGDGDVYGAVQTYNEDGVDAAYAVLSTAGGGNAGAAATVMEDVFSSFENAAVHEALEEADHDAYEGFEEEMESYIGALEDGSGVGSGATAFADATLRGQFAVVGAVDDAPVDDSGSSEESGGHGNLEGGPNVVSGVPDDADHVVDMKAIAFDPESLTVSKGDKVAFKHVGGEPHSVTAREDTIPDDADYWASGGFDSESDANTGWDEGKGAVKSGESYVHTFETVGDHAYYCIPHEMAGMEGTVTVEQ